MPALPDRRLVRVSRPDAACEWFVGKETGAYRDHVKFAHLLVEADLEFHRATRDERALSRAQRNGEVAYANWKAKPASELIANASVARMLWLLAEHKSLRMVENDGSRPKSK